MVPRGQRLDEKREKATDLEELVRQQFEQNEFQSLNHYDKASYLLKMLLTVVLGQEALPSSLLTGWSVILSTYFPNSYRIIRGKQHITMASPSLSANDFRQQYNRYFIKESHRLLKDLLLSLNAPEMEQFDCEALIAHLTNFNEEKGWELITRYPKYVAEVKQALFFWAKRTSGALIAAQCMFFLSYSPLTDMVRRIASYNNITDPSEVAQALGLYRLRYGRGGASGLCWQVDATIPNSYPLAPNHVLFGNNQNGLQNPPEMGAIIFKQIAVSQFPTCLRVGEWIYDFIPPLAGTSLSWQLTDYRQWYAMIQRFGIFCTNPASVIATLSLIRTFTSKQSWPTTDLLLLWLLPLYLVAFSAAMEASENDLHEIALHQSPLSIWFSQMFMPWMFLLGIQCAYSLSLGRAVVEPTRRQVESVQTHRQGALKLANNLSVVGVFREERLAGRPYKPDNDDIACIGRREPSLCARVMEYFGFGGYG